MGLHPDIVSIPTTGQCQKETVLCLVLVYITYREETKDVIPIDYLVTFANKRK